MTGGPDGAACHCATLHLICIHLPDTRQLEGTSPMTLDADVIVDRRRLRRKLTFWRVIAALGVVAAIIIGGGAALGLNEAGKSRPHIARVDVSGLIIDDRARLQMIEEIKKNPAVKGVLFAINSPGGSTTGGEGMVDAIAALRETKPVAAHIGTVGASAGYMIAIAADHVVARRTSITASIGVLMQFGNAKKLLETIGVEMDAVKSAPLKATPDFYSDTSSETRAMIASIVNDTYEWFVGFVSERRHIDMATTRKLADGRIMTGAQALEAKLIDEIGGENAAIAWLGRQDDVPANLPVITWKAKDGLADQLGLAGTAGRLFGQGVAEAVLGASELRKIVLPEGLMLDGLVSVWQAPSIAKAEVTGGANQ